VGLVRRFLDQGERALWLAALTCLTCVCDDPRMNKRLLSEAGGIEAIAKAMTQSPNDDLALLQGLCLLVVTCSHNRREETAGEWERWGVVDFLTDPTRQEVVISSEIPGMKLKTRWLEALQLLAASPACRQRLREVKIADTVGGGRGMMMTMMMVMLMMMMPKGMLI
jgi:hypothetical protein